MDRRNAVRGSRFLDGQLPGDEGYEAGDEDKSKVEDSKDADGAGSTNRTDRFGEWWRARLVSEFEKDLGGLAAVSGKNTKKFTLIRNRS